MQIWRGDAEKDYFSHSWKTHKCPPFGALSQTDVTQKFPVIYKWLTVKVANINLPFSSKSSLFLHLVTFIPHYRAKIRFLLHFWQISQWNQLAVILTVREISGTPSQAWGGQGHPSRSKFMLLQSMPEKNPSSSIKFRLSKSMVWFVGGIRPNASSMLRNFAYSVTKIYTLSDSQWT